MEPHRYLCSIPILQPNAPENDTATELAKAEEAKELTRATEHGWDLVAQPAKQCLYFMSGWWTYSFCSNREVVQYHAMASTPRGQPPKRDPKDPEYVLGRYPTIPASATRNTEPGQDPVPAEIHNNGDRKYLVQKLEGGTICDLTNRPRTIEVQYHCVPGMKGDKISWLKEVTICSYVMGVNTGRLCDDVAFMPAKNGKANPISCQLIADAKPSSLPLLDEKYTTSQKDHFDNSPEEEAGEAASDGVKDVTVGGIVVGARNVISAGDKEGEPPIKLPSVRNFVENLLAGEKTKVIETIAKAAPKAEGGNLEILSDKDLEALKLDTKLVDKMIDQMKEQIKSFPDGPGWRVDLVELADGERELRAYVDAEEDSDAAKADDPEAKGSDGKKDSQTANKAQNKDKAKTGEKKKTDKPKKGTKTPKKDPKKDEDETTGSEEQFKDEL